MREQELYIIKSNCSGKMVVAFTIEEKLFNVKPILPIGAAHSLFIFVVLKFPNLAALLVLFPA